MGRYLLDAMRRHRPRPHRPPLDRGREAPWAWLEWSEARRCYPARMKRRARWDIFSGALTQSPTGAAKVPSGQSHSG
ncbi:hypothetical protein EMPG_17405 [Blastomyces silverae]|uniref:Uncharacterized protein n=1 Tax=Blastomyces silverae TaxID=2060906 RepID=A0A0H1B6T2_9EURO|nr:hypothetical protein EMPG_17405 [Blastomyces silverae]